MNLKSLASWVGQEFTLKGVLVRRSVVAEWFSRWASKLVVASSSPGGDNNRDSHFVHPLARCLNSLATSASEIGYILSCLLRVMALNKFKLN